MFIVINSSFSGNFSSVFLSVPPLRMTCHCSTTFEKVPAAEGACSLLTCRVHGAVRSMLVQLHEVSTTAERSCRSLQIKRVRGAAVGMRHCPQNLIRSLLVRVYVNVVGFEKLHVSREVWGAEVKVSTAEGAEGGARTKPSAGSWSWPRIPPIAPRQNHHSP